MARSAALVGEITEAQRGKRGGASLLAWGDSASDADRVIRDVGGWSRFTLGAEMGRSLLRPYAEATDTTKGVESLG
jgi:hypothetical protein